MRAQAKECNLMMSKMTNSTDYETLLAESNSLMREYERIHYDIQFNNINMPPCWLSLIPLKTEYFKALSHVYFAKNSAKCNKNQTGDEKNRFRIIKSHLQSAQSSHEEILRIVRMSKDLRVSLFSLIIV